MTSLRAAESTLGRPLGKVPGRMITFRDYMESALYSAGGYYERRTPTEDFYTAPELHPAFAGVLAGEIVERFKLLQRAGVPGPYFVVEMGSGEGRLGAAILRRFREAHAGWLDILRYVFVERSETALLKSISTAGDRVLGYSRLEDVPACSGVFFSNELVDAFPVHLLQKRDGRMFEVYVQTAGPEGTGIRGGEGVRAELGELSKPELGPVAEAVCPNLLDGGRHAVNLEAKSWLGQVSERLERGWLLTIDYGKRFGRAGAPNPPRSFYKHQVTNEVTARPGRQDLTASVDFDDLIESGAKRSLALESYTTLSRFLLDRGILNWMPESENPNDVAAYKQRAQIKTLLHPEGMGEAFKVLIQVKEQSR
ncbi:MAG: SAM-dependent methyltransferase [Elusimicrobia bacterium]|nr:SAM-dependent methyltransferase [Elusimicrobiota bacterium]